MSAFALKKIIKETIMMDFTVRKADTADIPRLMDILNSATLKLLKKGVQQWEYPWDEKTVASFVEKGEFYIVLCDGVPRACFGIKDYSENAFDSTDKTGLYWYHLATHPDYDKKGAGYAACGWVQDYARKIGRKIYFDCWAGNKSLINYYTFMGFVPLGQFPEEDYFVMAFRTE